MSFIKVNGINLHYEIRGSGPRVLFLHGIGADLKNLVGIFNSPVPQQFTVLAFDYRGLGESDSPAEPFSIADMAEDAAGLAAAVGWDRYHVLGASMGGMVAQELVLRYPDVVDRLVLGVTNAGGANAGPQVIDKLDQMSTAEKLKLSDTRQDEAWAAANPEMVTRFEEQSRAAREALQGNPDFFRGFNNQVQAVLQHDTFNRLQQITAPTLVFGGRYDGSNPPEITRALADQIPGARYELFESGHGSWYFDPAAWQLIIEFLRG
ncbi:alpha/beta fold hydrolase [Phosphitispora fastidiosa]|uniref:alpha/beta fold hydrolase n=1 Tax=Phosphitispora fastidiosa TaxID=2837202 RepID=UPI001E52E883|nr:alpha/beta fold hydrolase [Phosphitispora fastidiosa]MBU7007290.1 3-oxoadipate enol-lactonase [Phosphitispora fastidiosa]